MPIDFQAIADASLYEKLERETINFQAASKHKLNQKCDMFCIQCEQDSIFRVSNLAPGGQRTLTNAGNSEFFRFYSYFLKCERNNNHEMTITIYVTKEHVIKCGQYPSVADLEIPKVKRYQPILSKDRLIEFTRAIGLNSHGVGIGSFAYLRRIFEHLIEEAHSEAKQADGWDEDVYARGRVTEKIKLLHHHLPEFMSENLEIYGILSKGIHELSEEHCLEYYPILKESIELILDEKLAEKLKQEKMRTLKKSLGSIHAKHK